MPKDNPSVGRRVISRTIAKTLCLRSFIRSCVGSATIVATLLTISVTGAIFGFYNTRVYAQTPNTTINYQARILNFDGSLVADGDYHVEFKIYNTATASGSPDQGACTKNGGTADPSCLWIETRTTGNLIRVANGYVSANLGSVTAFPTNMPWGNNLYITMRVGGKAVSPTWDSEMVNFTTGVRMKVTAVPLAFISNNVASGNTSTASTDSNNISVQTGNATGTTSNSGGITIDAGTATATAGSINIGSANASALTIGRTGVTTTLQGSIALTGAGTALTVTNDAAFNGNTTIGNASTDTLTVNANANFTGNLSIAGGNTFTNSGSSVYTAQAVSNLPTGGAIGTAAATVDGATTFNISQTTISQAITLPSPTTITAGRIVYVNNVGSASFTMYGTTIGTNGSNAFIWNGSQWVTTVSLSGSSISVVGTIDSQTKSADGAVIVGNAIYFQTADATNVGLVSIGAQTLAGAKTFSSTAIFDGGATITSGQTLTVNGDGFTDLTGAGLTISSGALTVDTTSATGAFINGGNTFSGASTIGNNNNADLGIKTNNTTRLTVLAGGNLSATGQLLLDGTGSNQSQLIVRANTGQTVANPLVLLQNSSSVELARINATTTSLYFGNAAGGSSAGGNNNTGIGASALGSVLTGAGNTTLGSGALASVSVNDNNTAVGYNAGNLSTGSSNIFLGKGAGANATTGSNNIIIGAGINASSAGVSNELRIGGVLQGDTSTLAAQFNGALTVVGLLTGSAGATVSGATISLNASSNNITNINTGTSTGAVNIASGSGANAVAIGNSASTTTVLGATNINTSGAATTTIGNAGAVLTVNGAATFGAAGTGLAVTNNATIGGTLQVTSATTLIGNATLGVTGTTTGNLAFKGATAASGTINLVGQTNPTGTQTITLPDASGTVLLGAAGSGNAIVQVPTSNVGGTQGANIIAPTAAGIVGLTVNGTSSTAATALAVSQPSAAAGITIASASNTATNGLSFSGTFTNLINATNFNVTNGGTVSATSGLLSPLHDSVSGVLNIGTSNATVLTVGGTTNTTAISLQGAVSSTYDIGTSTGTGIITLGKSTAAEVVNILSGNTTTGIQAVNIANGITGNNTTVSILSGVGTAGASSLLIGNNTRVTSIDIGNIAAAASRTINLGTGANIVGIDTINIGTGSSTVAGGKTINIGNGTPTGSGSNLITIGSTALASTTTINAGTGLLNFGTTQAQFTEVTGTRILTVQTRTSNIAGSNLTVQAGSAGAGASAFTGGALTLQGGSAGGTGSANGGNVSLVSGVGTGSGVKGLVTLDTPAFQTAAVQNFTVSANITQANIDSNGVILISANAAGYIATLSNPTLGSAANGRIIYITNIGIYDMTLSVNGGGAGNTVTLKPNTSATMVWYYNGGSGAWTAAGASSSTDLQAAYNNTATSAGGAELVLNAPGGSADGLTIRNNATTPIIGGLLEVQSSVGSNIFTVNNNAVEYATNGGAETQGGSVSTFPATTWDTTTGGTVDRYNSTTGGYDPNNIATGQASVRVQTTAVNHGARNRITLNGTATTLTNNLTYTVSLAVRGAVNFSTLDVLFSPDGTTSGTTSCISGKTVTVGAWTRITCTFVASGTITSSNSILIRQTDATARTFYIDNLSVNVNASSTFAADGSVDSALGTNWTAFGAGTTVTRDTTTIYDTSGSVRVDTTNNTDRGVTNNLTITPAISTQYLVTFYAKLSAGTFTDLRVRYSRDGGTNFVTCVDYSTQTLSTTAWTKITCLLTSDGTTATNPDLIIDQPTAPGSTRTFYVDAVSMTLNNNNASNVQIGGANKGGPVTLITLDRSSSAPIAANNDAYLGSMYFNTTTGRIQCYEASGWGACGAPPDNIVNLNPEYAGAVLNGSGVGTMTADFCSNDAALSINSALCSTGQAKNFYKWTSPQATQQTYSIYVTYQLPSTFNGFASDDTVQLIGRVDNTTNASVTYQMFKSTGSAVTQCGTGETDVITGGGGSANTWYSYGINGNESTGCSFNSSSAGNFVIFKINLKATSNATAYVSTLSFTTTGR
jgi:hypothetical protein